MSNVNMVDLLGIDGTVIQWPVQWLASRCGEPYDDLPEGVSVDSVELLAQRMAVDVGATFLASKNGIPGIFFDAEVVTIESDGKREDLQHFKLESRAEVDQFILADLAKIMEKFPSLEAGLVIGDNHWGGRAGACGFLPGDTSLSNAEISEIAEVFCNMGKQRDPSPDLIPT